LPSDENLVGFLLRTKHIMETGSCCGPLFLWWLPDCAWQEERGTASAATGALFGFLVCFGEGVSGKERKLFAAIPRSREP
jgi:hypothetical protein